MGRRSETRFADLVRDHSPYDTIADLGRAIGEADLGQKLHHARQEHRLPSGATLARIATVLDPTGVSHLVEALARDGQLPGYTGRDIAGEMATAIDTLDPHHRRLAFLILGIPDPRQLTPRPTCTNATKHGNPGTDCGTY